MKSLFLSPVLCLALSTAALAQYNSNAGRLYGGPVSKSPEIHELFGRVAEREAQVRRGLPGLAVNNTFNEIRTIGTQVLVGDNVSMVNSELNAKNSGDLIASGVIADEIGGSVNQSQQ